MATFITYTGKNKISLNAGSIYSATRLEFGFSYYDNTLNNSKENINVSKMYSYGIYDDGNTSTSDDYVFSKVVKSADSNLAFSFNNVFSTGLNLYNSEDINPAESVNYPSYTWNKLYCRPIYINNEGGDIQGGLIHSDIIEVRQAINEMKFNYVDNVTLNLVGNEYGNNQTSTNLGGKFYIENFNSKFTLGLGSLTIGPENSYIKSIQMTYPGEIGGSTQYKAYNCYFGAYNISKTHIAETNKFIHLNCYGSYYISKAQAGNFPYYNSKGDSYYTYIQFNNPIPQDKLYYSSAYTLKKDLYMSNLTSNYAYYLTLYVSAFNRDEFETQCLPVSNNVNGQFISYIRHAYMNENESNSRYYIYLMTSRNKSFALNSNSGKIYVENTYIDSGYKNKNVSISGNETTKVTMNLNTTAGLQYFYNGNYSLINEAKLVYKNVPLCGHAIKLYVNGAENSTDANAKKFKQDCEITTVTTAKPTSPPTSPPTVVTPATSNSTDTDLYTFIIDYPVIGRQQYTSETPLIDLSLILRGSYSVVSVTNGTYYSGGYLEIASKTATCVVIVAKNENEPTATVTPTVTSTATTSNSTSAPTMATTSMPTATSTVTATPTSTATVTPTATATPTTTATAATTSKYTAAPTATSIPTSTSKPN